jgi:hypothetical protein
MFQMSLVHPLGDRHPLPTRPKNIPGCLTASPHSTHPTATILAFALGHGDQLQSRQLQAIWFARARRPVTSIVDAPALPPSTHA